MLQLFVGKRSSHSGEDAAPGVFAIFVLEQLFGDMVLSQPSKFGNKLDSFVVVAAERIWYIAQGLGE